MKTVSKLNFSSVDEAIKELMEIDVASCGEPTLTRCVKWVENGVKKGLLNITKEAN